jgi:hypothetical protein
MRTKMKTDISNTASPSVGCRAIVSHLWIQYGYDDTDNAVMPDKVPQSVRKTWHKNLSTLADVTGDSMIPVPGTYQGGWTPRFI